MQVNLVPIFFITRFTEVIKIIVITNTKWVLAMSRVFAKYLRAAHLVSTAGLWGETAFVILFIDEHRQRAWAVSSRLYIGWRKICGASLSSQYPLSHFFTPSCSAACVHEGSSHVVKLQNQFLCKDGWLTDPAVIDFAAVVRLSSVLLLFLLSCPERRYTLLISVPFLQN